MPSGPTTGLLLVALASGLAAQELAQETILAARIREHLRGQFGHLPDYTCLENIARFHRQPDLRAKMLPLDVVRLEVLYSGTEEWYGWPGDRVLSEPNPVKFIASGMIGNGLFALFVNNIFLSNAATYTYQGVETVSGRDLVKYEFHVSRLVSRQRISLIHGSGTVGLKGFFWADPRSLDLMRLTVEADEIPPYLPLADMSARLDFAHTRIGDSDVLLAQDADLHMAELSGEANYDHFEFTHCSQFHAESKIHFDAAEPSPAEAPGGGGAGQPEEKVPALLMVTVQLTTPIGASDAVGTPVEGRTSGDAMRKGRIAIPDGSKVRGRIRRLEQSGEKGGSSIVGIEFTEIEIGGVATRFYADLVKLDRRGGIQQALSTRVDPPSYPGMRAGELEHITLPEIAGVASFFVPGKTLALPKDFWMVWRTRSVLHGN